MTKEFILNTLLPYKENPSNCANEDSGCVYLTADGKKCAVGKHLIDGEHQKYVGGVLGLFEFYDKDRILTEEAKAQGIPDDVWVVMQYYHDSIASGKRHFRINKHVKQLEEFTGFEFPELMFN